MALTMRDWPCVIVEAQQPAGAAAGSRPQDLAGQAKVTDTELRELEGRQVSLALVDGSRLDAVTLVSAGRGRTRTLWLYSAGSDLFVARDAVLDAWEPAPSRRTHHVTNPSTW
jgi:hypothetical protein